MLVEAITVMSGEMSISWRGFQTVTNLIFIHSTTNFYVTSAPKTFLRILTGDSMHPIGHHVPWFKFQIMEKDEIVYMFLCSRSQVSMRRQSIMLVEAITVVPYGMFVSWEVFTRQRNYFLFIKPLISMQRQRQNLFNASWQLILCIQSTITCHE